MVGEVLRILRIANDMTIKKAATESQVSAPYITEMEKGKKINPSIDILKKLCLVYDLKVSEFMDLDDYHNSIVGTKEELKIYRMMLIKSLQMYQEREEKSNSKELVR